MRLAISNLAWDNNFDLTILKLMSEYDFTGLEIAPTKLFGAKPYDRLKDASIWSKEMLNQYGFVIPSMQSIWYGRTEMMFSTSEERSILSAYTKQAIDFAQVIGCNNIVFGCPRNRCFVDGASWNEGVMFFRELGEYAYAKNTTIGMEANPVIYNTNYINDTQSAIDLIKEVDSPGFKLNLDIGTMIYNEESVELLVGEVGLINHVHISEPYLKTIVPREIHIALKKILENENYDKYISIEMGKIDDINIIENTMKYIRGIFE